MKSKWLWVAAISAGLYLLLRSRKAAAAAPPAVAGTVVSGSQFGTFDTNVLSDSFGQAIPN